MYVNAHHLINMFTIYMQWLLNFCVFFVWHLYGKVFCVHTHAFVCTSANGVLFLLCVYVQVEAILGQWSQVLHSISFLLPEDLKSLVHREAQVGRGVGGLEA